jgi:hypothetical protein
LLMHAPQSAVDATTMSDLNLLWKRWPDAELEHLFAGHRQIFKEIAESVDIGAGLSNGRSPFSKLCREVVRRQPAAAAPGCDPVQYSHLPTRGSGQLTSHLMTAYRTACSLGMLMHYSVMSGNPRVLVNHRRPGRLTSSYPNPPVVATEAADFILSALLTADVPTKIASRVQAERFARSALTFRVIDPSMECGELLVAILIGIADRVLKTHEWGSPTARLLVEALVRRACGHCLWGLDVDPNAVHGLAASVALLGRCLGIRGLKIRHAMIGDAIDLLLPGKMGKFDGVINNPPWQKGSSATHAGWSRLATVEHYSDYYVAFLELALGALRPGGAFGLVVPCQVVAARNAAGARRCLADRGNLARIVLLPRASFAHASVRGALLLGRISDNLDPKVRVDIFPHVSRLGERAPIATKFVYRTLLAEAGRKSWLGALAPAGRSVTTDQMVRLDRIAGVLTGIRRDRAGRSPIPRCDVNSRSGATAGFVRGRHIQPYRVLPPDEVLPIAGPIPSEIARHSVLRFRPRVYVREVCLRAGPVFSAVALRGTVPRHGVLTVVPHGINHSVLAAILHSSFAWQFVSTRCASFLKVDFQRITAAELGSFPIHAALITAPARAKLGLDEPGRRERLLANRLANLAGRFDSSHELAGRPRDLRTVDALIDQLYAAPGRLRP